MVVTHELIRDKSAIADGSHWFTIGGDGLWLAQLGKGSPAISARTWA